MVALPRATSLPEGVVSDGEVSGPGGPRPSPQELRRRRRTAAQRAPRGRQPADRRPRDRAAAHRGRQAARRRGPLPGCRGDRHAPRRGHPRPPGGRLRRRPPTAPPRMQVVLVAARRTMVESLLEAVKGAGPEGRRRRPRRLRPRAHARRAGGDGADESARVFCHLGGVTNLAIAVGSNLLLHPAALGGLGRGRTPARGSPTRSGCRSTTT